ncbi:MAG: hypothetical protein ACLFSY_08700 [Desulfonatronovibrionaceae bacterium]
MSPVPAKRKQVVFMVFSFFLALCLGLGRVWVNVERVDLAYELEKLQQDVDKNRRLQAKLIVERDNLLSSYNLQQIAEEQGLEDPQAGQVRKMRGK